jgi:hypothetical protein
MAQRELGNKMGGASIISQRAQLPFVSVLCHSANGSTFGSVVLYRFLGA